MINEQIRDREVRLIGENGEQLGIMSAKDAYKMARDADLDLVKIAPTAKPPVCKIIDYGKYKYEQAMKAKQARKKQTRVEVKEMKFRPKIDVGDYETKKGHVMRFLRRGDRVKITIMFRGREMAQDGGTQHAHAGLAHQGGLRRRTGARVQAGQGIQEEVEEVEELPCQR